MRRRLEPQILAQLAPDYRSGRSTTWLMQTYHLSKGSVLGILEDQGVEMRGQGGAPDRLDEVIQLYGAGWSLMALSAELDCSPEPIREALLRAGVTLRRPFERGSRPQ